MKRRLLLGAVGAATSVWPLGARAQPQTVRLIGMLGPQASGAPLGDALVAGLQELGHAEGRTFRVEARWANGRFETLPELARELTRLKVDVLVASLTQAALAAKDATTTIPVVMAGVGDPVAVGLIESLARPGGNVTGTGSLLIDVVGKQIELLKEVAPTVDRVAVLWNPANPAFQSLQLRQVEMAARATGLQLQLVEARAPGDLAAAFAAIARESTPALAVLGDPLFTAHAQAIGGLASRGRLISVSNNRTMAEAGILLTYGPSLLHLHKRAAIYVDRILKGAQPADLPVEQPTSFELIVNLKAATALGVALPRMLLARATEVLE